MGYFAPFVGDIFSFFAVFFLTMVCVMALVIVGAILLGRMAYRRVRADARVNRTALTVRMAFTPPGAQRNVLRLRRRLADAVLAGNDALTILRTHGAVQGDMARLVPQVNRAAATLDAQLRLMQSEPDSGRMRDTIAPLTERVTEIEGIVRHVREAAYVVLEGDAVGTTARLTGDVRREVSALTAGVATLRATAAAEGAPVPPRTRKENYV